MLWLEIHHQSSSDNVPSKALFELWIGTALAGKPGEIGIKLVDAEEIQRLNKQYRHKDQVTDVLSFPANSNDDFPVATSIEQHLPYLGDIAICVERLQLDAKELGKSELQHWAHITIHAALHLLGYDHMNAHDQQEMQLLENRIMEELQFAAPWCIGKPDEH